MPNLAAKRIALVLGGGGLKGFAHIGVLRALAERGIEPTIIAGTSIGALIGAAYANGTPIETMAARALRLRRKDLFRINHVGMMLERMRNPSIYLEQPLRDLVAESVPNIHFEELRRRLLVNTVDVAHGTQLVWGLRGLRDVSIAEAVYASCALPGFFPPGMIRDRPCVDGGVMDNLPVAIASQGMDAVIAVDVGSTQLMPRHDVTKQGFAAIYMRAATTMMHELQLEPLREWSGPPMVLIRPPLGEVEWFDFTRTEALIDAGYIAATEALHDFARHISSAGGIYPRRRYRITVSAACVGCSLCTALAPDVMAMSAAGRAFPEYPVVEWSPADGDFVRQCPTGAITATPVT